MTRSKIMESCKSAARTGNKGKKGGGGNPYNVYARERLIFVYGGPCLSVDAVSEMRWCMVVYSATKYQA